MDKAIFQFSSFKYSLLDVEELSRKTCEHLANVDSDNVTKFDIENESLQEHLNSNNFDLDTSFFRVFI